jgi:hypothetical protein
MIYKAVKDAMKVCANFACERINFSFCIASYDCDTPIFESLSARPDSVLARVLCTNYHCSSI